MNYKKILITGGTGKLGKLLVNLLVTKGFEVISPSRSEMDITDKSNVFKFIKKQNVDALIHCAALASVYECEKDSRKAMEVNLEGTWNVVNSVLDNKEMRFVYISTDYVYAGTDGPYKESDLIKPFSIYGLSKLGGEYVVNILENHCIIRASFFDPGNIPFDTSPNDSYCSKLSLQEMGDAIVALLENKFIGTVNVGQERTSLYDILRKYKPELKPVKLAEIPSPVKRAKDSSLDIGLWKSLTLKN